MRMDRNLTRSHVISCRPGLARFRPISGEISSSLVDSDQFQSKLFFHGEIGKCRAKVGAGQILGRQFRADVAESGAISAKFGASLPKCVWRGANSTSAQVEGFSPVKICTPGPPTKVLSSERV